jgi:cytochrome c oxidase subunit 4
METEHVIPEEHVVPPRVYLTIFGVLMVLTVITVAAAFMDWGFLNVFIAVTIAVVKATLVILYFMHLRYSSKLTQVIVASGVLWLIIMLVLTLQDYLTRGWDLG